MPSATGRREGVTAGLLSAATILGWLAAVDGLTAGDPWRTTRLLGAGLAGVVTVAAPPTTPTAVATFGAALVVLCGGYGVAALALVRRAAAQPSLLVAAVAAFVLMNLAFIGASAVLAEVALGARAWLTVAGGHLAASVVALAYIARRHPELRGEWRRAADD